MATDRSPSGEKLNELAGLPTGIKVTTFPDPVRARKGGRSGRKLTWEYETRVETLKGELFVREFGAFLWDGEKWVLSTIYNRPFGSEEFAEWYDCPDAALLPGKTYVDPTNYSGGDFFANRRARWYFIGADRDGNLYKGEATVSCEGRLAEGEPAASLRNDRGSGSGFTSGWLFLLLRLVASAAAGWLLTFFLFYRLALVRAHVRGRGFWLLVAACSLAVFLLTRRD